jgi:hypothetical protein
MMQNVSKYRKAPINVVDVQLNAVGTIYAQYETTVACMITIFGDFNHLCDSTYFGDLF